MAYLRHTVILTLFLLTLGMSRGFAATVIWDGGGTTNNWSDEDNWSGNVAPNIDDDVVFNGDTPSNRKDSVVDSSWIGHVNYLGQIKTLTVASGYTGTITINKNNLSTRSYNQQGGTVNLGTGVNFKIYAAGFTNSEISGGTFNASAGSLHLYLQTFTVSGGTVTFPDYDSGSGSLRGDLKCEAVTLVKSGGTLTSTGTDLIVNTSAMTISSAFSFRSLDLDTGGNNGLVTNGNVTISGSASLGNATLTGSAKLILQGATTFATNFIGTSFDGSGEIEFTGSNQTVSLPVLDSSYFPPKITINSATAAVTATGSGTLHTYGLVVTAGSFDLNGHDWNNHNRTFSVADNGTFKLQGGESFTTVTPSFSSASTVVYQGTSSYTTALALGNTYGNVTFNGSGGVWEPDGAVTVNGNLTIASGATFDIDGQDISVTGTFSNSGTFRLTGGESTVTLTNDTDSGTIQYDGSGAASLKLGNTYYSVNFSGAGTWQHNATLDANGTVTIGSGVTLDSAGQNVTVGGNWANSGTYTSGSNTVTFDGSAAQSIVSGGNSGDGYDFNNLTVNKAGGTLTLSTNDVEIDGVFTLTAGTLDANARTMTVRGNWTNGGGTFTHGNGTVNLGTASQTISGSNTFYNLTKQVSSAVTLSFTIGTTQTVAGTLTLNGASGQALTLASTGGSDWNLTPQGPVTVSHLSVSRSNNTGSVISCWTGCTDGSNNTNWSFAPPNVTLSVNNATIAENGGIATFTATLSAASGVNTTINLSYSGTGTNITDYTRSSATITITAGSTTGTVTVTGVNDSLDEEDETVIVDISSIDNSYATEATPQQQTTTITDDDAAPSVAWTASSQSSADETNGATMTVTAQLSAASGRNISIPFTVTGTATGSGTDYSITASPLTINAGGTTVSATITLVGDTLDEDNETVILTIGSPTNASQGATLIHTATITDDDAEPTVAWTSSSQSTAETNGATLTVTAQLSAVSAKNISVPFTVTGTATGAGTDYTITSSPISINAGSTTATATVTIVGDNYDEADETMILTIDSPTNASQGATLVHTATITDDDATPTLTLTSVTVGEADSSATVTVSMTNYSGSSVTVDYATSNGTATAGSDYTTASGTLTWTSGQTGNKTFNVSITDDSIHEDNETVALAISNVAHATLSVSAATLTITDNDASSSGGSSGSGDGSGGASGGGGGSGGSSGSSGSSGSGGESETGGSSGSSDSGEDSPLSVQASHVDTGLVYETHGGEGILLATSDDADISTEGVQYTVDSVTVTIPAGSGTTRDIVVTSEPASDDEDIIFSSPYASSGAGLAVIIPRTSLIEDASFLDMEVAPSVSALTVPILRSESVSGSTVLYGRQAGDHFGAYVASGDVNGDGSIEYLFAAPGEGLYGEIHIFNQDLVEVATIFGSADQPIRSILVAQMMGASTADINFGPGNRALNSDLVNVSALELSEYSSRITSLEGSSNVEGSLDLSEIDTNAVVGAGNTYQSFTTGDVNGDNTNDLIVSTSNSIAIFLGPITPATSVSYTNASHIITGDGGSFGQSLATADINHDGIDDLLIGAPDYDPHGAIYVLFGRYFWDTDSITNQISLGLASQVTGSTGRIGSDMLIRSADAAAFTLYTPETATSTLTLTLTSDVVIDQSNEVHVAGNESALGCTLLLREEGGARDRSTSVMIGILLLAMIALRSQVLLGKNRILQRRPRVEVDRL